MAKEELPWFPCIPTKFLGALAGLGTDEQLIYLIAVFRIYESGGPIADDAAAFARRTHMSPKRAQRAIDVLISTPNKLYRTPDGRLANPKADDVLADMNGRHEKAVTSGKAGAEERERRKSFSEAPEKNLVASKKRQEKNADDSMNGSKGAFNSLEAKSSYLQRQLQVTPHSPKGELPPKGLFADEIASTEDDWPEDAWERFWQAYPHKVGKADARRKFDSVRKRRKDRPTWAVLWFGLQHYIRTKPSDRPWCNPATWIYQERWADQPAPNVPAGGGRPQTRSGMAAIVARDMMAAHDGD